MPFNLIYISKIIVFFERSLSYLSTFSFPNIQYKSGFEKNLPIKNAITDPIIIPIVANQKAINGPKIAVPASIVNVLGIGIKITCSKVIIV